MKLAAFIVACTLSVGAWAGIGQVTEMTGTASIKRGSAVIPVAKSTAVEMNDRVETRNGRLKITFLDGTVVTVTESSSLIVDDFVYDARSGAGKLGLKAAAGTVRYASGRIAATNPNSVKINTPTASIAVRGTDFVMSVAETGASMIILMPTCETEQNVNLRGLTCGSGRIDVEAGGTVTTLDRPYQATIVETASTAPSQPVVVDLNGGAVSNTLMLSPPRTGSGATIAQAARQAAEQTGDAMVNSREAQAVAKSETAEVVAQRVDTERASVVALELGNSLKAAGIAITDVSNNESVYKIWRDASATQQTGWGYERLSPSGYNYANIALAMDTKALIVVTQDRVTDAYNSNMASSRSYGTIIINQSWR